jgi:hypothetical protein
VSAIPVWLGWALRAYGRLRSFGAGPEVNPRLEELWGMEALVQTSACVDPIVAMDGVVSCTPKVLLFPILRAATPVRIQVRARESRQSWPGRFRGHHHKPAASRTWMSRRQCAE